MIFIFHVEFFCTVLNKHSGQVKGENDRQDLTILISSVRYNFIKNLFTAKSREFRSLFLIGQASRPYNTSSSAIAERPRCSVVSCGANINVVLRIHRTLLYIAVAVSFTC